MSIPTPLRSYTSDAAEVEASGATLGDVLADLERQFPGIRFRVVDEVDRVRRHIKLFVNDAVIDALDHPLNGDERVHVVCALSGG